MSVITTLFGSVVPGWVYEAVIVLALAGGAVLYLEHRGARQELAELQVSSAKLVAQANAEIAKETSAHAADVKANQEKTDAALAANTALHAQLADSVRNFDAYRRAHPDVPRTAGGSGTAGGGECGARSCGDLASELAVRGNDLARSVGDLSASLQACQRDRDSLTGLPR